MNAALALWLAISAVVASAQGVPADFPPPPMEYPGAASPGSIYPTTAAPSVEPWIAPMADQPAYVDADVYCYGSPVVGPSLVHPSPPETWFWQVLPDGLIYRSYQAGVHEPRIGIVLLGQRDGRSLWDAMVGGRVGLLRFGSGDALRPQGWQLDIEGAALPRLTLDDQRDLESVDFRVGAPLTYGIGDWQFKFGYYHLSSHLGDEFAIRTGLLGSRINYVRDALVLGASYYPDPLLRLYSEAGYAMNADGGAEPWEFQFGAEASRPGPTGPMGSPFLAVNGHLREEHDFGGDLTAQAGWLWRGRTGQVMRIGAHYFNGKSSQYQTFDDSEEQAGFGMWYDF